MKSLVSCLMALIFLTLPCFALEVDQESQNERSFGSLEKSLLIPGWGQLAEKKYLKGAAFLSAEIFCLYKVFAHNHKGNENYRLYKAAENVDDAVKYRELTERYDKRRNAFILAAAGVWALNLIDMYVIVKNKKKGNESVSLKLQSCGDRILGLALTVRF